MKNRKMMKKFIYTSIISLTLVMVLVTVFKLNQTDASFEGVKLAMTKLADTVSSDISGKAMGAGIGIGLAALGGTIGMGMAVAKSVDAIARQPEAEGKVRTTLMLGLVFIETVVIYALVVAILLVFVL